MMRREVDPRPRKRGRRRLLPGKRDLASPANGARQPTFRQSDGSKREFRTCRVALAEALLDVKPAVTRLPGSGSKRASRTAPSARQTPGFVATTDGKLGDLELAASSSSIEPDELEPHPSTYDAQLTLCVICCPSSETPLKAVFRKGIGVLGPGSRRHSGGRGWRTW